MPRSEAIAHGRQSERLFVDYAGDGVPIVVDRLIAEIRIAQIFVAVLGASSFTFARATPIGSTTMYSRVDRASR